MGHVVFLQFSAMRRRNAASFFGFRLSTFLTSSVNLEGAQSAQNQGIHPLLKIVCDHRSCMYLEILVEDASGKALLEHLVPKILGPKGKPHRYRIVNIQELKHRVMAQMPRKQAKTLPWDAILFQTLSVQLKVYGKTLPRKNGVVIVVVDLDYRNEQAFQLQLESLLTACDPAPEGFVRLAVEEGEAWILGDLNAVRRAYPFVREYVLQSYEQDSICETWELLADALFHGGSERLLEIGYPQIGREKHLWADNIGQYMDIDANRSPSFQRFRDTLRNAVTASEDI